MSDSDAAVAEILARELQASQSAAADGAAQLRDRQNEMAGVSKALMERLLEPRKPVAVPGGEEVQQIVAILTAQPRLVPAVKKFLEEKVAAINAAVDQILGPSPPGA